MNHCEGSLPSQLCSMTALTSLTIWNSDVASTNPFVTCTLSCLSSKMGGMPRSLTECASTTTVLGLCGIVAATNITAISGYSMWQCTSSGAVATQPCGSTQWTGLLCNGAGDVVAISLRSLGIAGNY